MSNSSVVFPRPSVSARSAPLVHELWELAPELRLGLSSAPNGTRIVDAGIAVPGGLEAGRRIAEICLGGIGRVQMRASTNFSRWSWHVDVSAADPILACLGSQYAGWSLSHGEGKGAFNALGSGPARAIGSKEPLFAELGYRDRAGPTCLVVETAVVPPIEVLEEVCTRCGIAGQDLTVILTPTSSLAGAVQIVARVLETALHKAHALHFPLQKIIDGSGSAPLCPPSPNLLTAMSRTNDAILFAGQVQLYVDAEDAEAESLATKLPSSSSPSYGRPFGEVFKSVNYDFYKIDPMLFSPAWVNVTSVRTGRSFHSGNINLDLLDESFTREFS